jgi:cardiolipin synthase
METLGSDNDREECCGVPAAEADGPNCVPRLTDTRGQFRLFTEGDRLYEAMLKAIASAQRSVRLESYIFADDEVGRWFAEALAERVRAGVEVRLHIDAACSLFWISRSLERYLRAQGVRVRWFHRWSWRDPLRYNRRNHRKMLVVDDEQVYVGGFNLHRENSRALFGETRWRDTHVGLLGEIALEGAKLFDAFWERERSWAPRQGWGINALVSNRTTVCRHAMRCLYADRFHGATGSIYLTTPYFVPDHRTQRGLRDAARRGVDVRLLVPRKSDVWLAQWAARAAYATLLGAGIRIYEYLPRVLHAKTVVVDDQWATVGTANFDYRSLFVNYELNLVTQDPDLCQQLRDQFFQDLSEAEEIFSGKWARRPHSRRIAETIGWMARRWL